LTVQALHTTFSGVVAGESASAADASRVKGSVKALLATARPPIAVVFINPRRVTSAAMSASGALIFIETHFGCSQRKERRREPLHSFIDIEFPGIQLFMLTFIRNSITTLEGGGIASYQFTDIKKAPAGAFLF
jgi:hypothetical protein